MAVDKEYTKAFSNYCEEHLGVKAKSFNPSNRFIDNLKNHYVCVAVLDETFNDGWYENTIGPERISSASLIDKVYKIAKENGDFSDIHPVGCDSYKQMQEYIKLIKCMKKYIIGAGFKYRFWIARTNNQISLFMYARDFSPHMNICMMFYTKEVYKELFENGVG
jgi:hypothetical protein